MPKQSVKTLVHVIIKYFVEVSDFYALLQMGFSDCLCNATLFVEVCRHVLLLRSHQLFS